MSRIQVNIFYTAPTAIRAIAKEGDEFVKQCDISSLRTLGTVGEPINPEAWNWYFNVIGRGECPIVDTWWQTETGGILITPLPGAVDIKPGMATLPFFGVQPVLVDDEGKEMKDTEASGALCIKVPWPGIMRGVYGDPKRFQETYFEQFPGYYVTGDGCRRDKDGYYRSPAASTTSSTCPVTAWAPLKWKARLLPTRPSRKPPWSACRTTSRARAFTLTLR